MANIVIYLETTSLSMRTQYGAENVTMYCVCGFMRVLKNDAIYTNTLFPVDSHIYIYIDIIPDVLDTSGESKNNIGPPSGGPKRAKRRVFRTKKHTWTVQHVRNM